MISARRAHVAYLLASPTRSSYVGFCPQERLSDVIEELNADESGSPLSIVRPWRLAATAQREAPEAAEAVAAAVSRASGFRARLAGMSIDLNSLAHPPKTRLNRASCSLSPSLSLRPLLPAAMRALASDGEGAPSLSQGGPRLDAARALDGMTYAMIEVANPDEPERCRTVRALVDTGATDCELKGRLIEELDLRPDSDAGFAVFETAAGIQTEAQVFQATVRACGREALCLLSPAELQDDDDDDDDDDEGEEGGAGGEGVDDTDAAFGFERVSDDALLGHDALAALGLAVDCGRRRLFPVP